MQRGYSLGNDFPEGQETTKDLELRITNGLEKANNTDAPPELHETSVDHEEKTHGLGGEQVGGKAPEGLPATVEQLDTNNADTTENARSCIDVENPVVFTLGYNIRDAFAFEDLPYIISLGNISVSSKTANKDTSCGETYVNGVPVIDLDPNDNWVQEVELTGTQWHELSQAAKEVSSASKKQKQTLAAELPLNRNVTVVGNAQMPACDVECMCLDADYQVYENMHQPNLPSKVHTGGHNLVHEVTPEVHVRVRKPSKHKRSPFTNKFGSVETSSQLAMRRILSLHHPFVSEIGVEVDYGLICEFGKWIDIGACPRSKKKLYPPKFNNLMESFDFGMYVVRKKEWFHVLNYGSKALTTTHLDVLFYYFRKMCMYDPTVISRVTTTDCLFDATLRNVYNEYIAHGGQGGVVESAGMIKDCIGGRHLRCNIPWIFMDEILCPVMVIESWHWILARVSFKERVIYVYDQSKSLAAYNKQVIEAVDPYITMIPVFLNSTDFYKKRSDLLYSGGPYDNKGLSDPFFMEFVTETPSFSTRDYGLFAAAFAEYYIQHQRLPLPDEDLSGLGSRYAQLLLKYGFMKQEQAAHSDFD